MTSGKRETNTSIASDMAKSCDKIGSALSGQNWRHTQAKVTKTSSFPWLWKNTIANIASKNKRDGRDQQEDGGEGYCIRIC